MSNFVQINGVFGEGFGFAPKKLMRDRRLTAEAKAIYCYIASYAGSGMSAFPGVDLMISDLCMGRKRFYDHRKLLVQYGYIAINTNFTKEKGKKVKRENNVYTLNMVVCEPPIDQDKDKDTKKSKDTQKSNEKEQNTEKSNAGNVDMTSSDEQFDFDTVHSDTVHSEPVQNHTTNSNSLKSNSFNSNSNNSSSSYRSYYRQVKGKSLTTTATKQIEFLKTSGLTDEVVMAAIDEADLTSDSWGPAYLLSILKRYIANNLLTLEAIKADKVRHEDIKKEQEEKKKAIKNTTNGNKYNKFNDYPQREYDFDDFENYLLGDRSEPYEA